MSKKEKVLAFATLGRDSNEEHRILTLLGALEPVRFAFDRSRKWAMFRKLLGEIRKSRPQLVVMEGTGVAGGAALILARLLFGQRYVVSSGDAVGPWVGSRIRLFGPIFGLYERVLCRLAAGFIGWTPYLVGRALTFGTGRAMTAPGWAPFAIDESDRQGMRNRTRDALGIPRENIVVGIAGSLIWSRRHAYCYGFELVKAAQNFGRSDVTVLIVGDGDGRAELERMAGRLPKGRVVFVGRVPQSELPGYYAAMDVASLPQSVDGVGSFRYTTKISEYLHFKLPFVTGQIPLAYDLDDAWLWRLPGNSPWDPRYIDGLANLLAKLDQEAISRKRNAIPETVTLFDRQTQVFRTEQFIRDLLESRE